MARLMILDQAKNRKLLRIVSIYATDILSKKVVKANYKRRNTNNNKRCKVQNVRYKMQNTK